MATTPPPPKDFDFYDKYFHILPSENVYRCRGESEI